MGIAAPKAIIRVAACSRPIEEGDEAVVIRDRSLTKGHRIGGPARGDDDLTGRPRSVKRHTPWLRSMSGERLQFENERTGLTPLEILLVLAVILVIGAYEYWFFFQAGSPFDQRSGRD